MNPSVPLNQFADARQVFGWLGSFWSQVYEDPQFLERYQSSRGILAIQLYLNLLEAIGLLDRQAAPVLHRERWYPIVLRQSSQGTGRAAALKLGMKPTPTLGPQLAGDFPTGVMFQLGGTADYARLSTYPLPTGLQTVMTVITDNIVDPAAMLVRDADFVIEDNTLVFRKGMDPFTLDAFPKVEITQADGTTDTEVVLWGCDAMFDRQYVYERLGYVLGIRTASTDYYKRLINATWDAITAGPTEELFEALLGAFYDVPTVIDAVETVDQVVTDQEGLLVLTDTHTYRLPATAVVRDEVVKGAELHRGEFLDTTIRLYSGVSDPTPAVVGLNFRSDVPMVTFPPGFFRARLQHGLAATWASVPLYSAGLDLNGNVKLWFPLIGASEDVEAYWLDVWRHCERNGIAMSTCFPDQLNGTLSEEVGAVCGYVEPLDYVLRNLVGANAVFVAVDTNNLPVSQQRDQAAVVTRMLRDVLPAYLHLFVVEHRTAGPDSYDLEQETGSEINAITWALTGRSTGTVGNRSADQLTYRSGKSIMRWIAVCK